MPNRPGNDDRITSTGSDRGGQSLLRGIVGAGFRLALLEFPFPVAEFRHLGLDESVIGFKRAVVLPFAPRPFDRLRKNLLPRVKFSTNAAPVAGPEIWGPPVVESTWVFSRCAGCPSPGYGRHNSNL